MQLSSLQDIADTLEVQGVPVQAMVKQHQLQLTIDWVFAQKEVGCVRVAVHVSMDEDHLIEGARHQLSHFLRLETQLLYPCPATIAGGQCES